MLTASCHCKAVRLEVPAAPDYFNDCQCSICRRYGARWGYYRPDQVRLVGAPGATEIYMWDAFILEFHRCRKCGCVTHWKDVDPAATRMGVNGRLFEPLDVATVPVRESAGPG